METNAYKLTDSDMKTYGGFQWQIGTTYTTRGKGSLCSAGWLHYYHDPLLAVLLNPIHANVNKPRLFEAHAAGEMLYDRGLKAGATSLTLLREIALPTFTIAQRAKFARLCATWAKACVGGPRMAPLDIAVKLAQLAAEAAS